MGKWKHVFSVFIIPIIVVMFSVQARASPGSMEVSVIVDEYEEPAAEDDSFDAGDTIVPLDGDAASDTEISDNESVENDSDMEEEDDDTEDEDFDAEDDDFDAEDEDFDAEDDDTDAEDEDFDAEDDEADVEDEDADALDGEPVDEETVETANLTITMSITGGRADTTKKFSFALTVGENVETFSLAGNESKTFADLPMDTDIFLKEDSGEYAAIWSYDGGAEELSSATGDTSFKLSGDGTLAIRNDLPEVAPTGTESSTQPFVIILVTALTLLGVSAWNHYERGRCE